MQDRRRPLRVGWTRLASLLALLVLMLTSPASDAVADPFTSFFDNLIVELEARSTALEGSTDKAEIKQKKTIDKLLKAFAKDSTGLDKDLKAAGKAIKKLAKAFPGDGTLEALIDAALTAAGGDIDALLDAAQDLVDTAPLGKCRDKAQKLLDQVEMLLHEADTTTDPAAVAKALTKALKQANKGGRLAAKALTCGPKLKPGISVATLEINGKSKKFADHVSNTNPATDDVLLATHKTVSNTLFVLISSNRQDIQLDFLEFALQPSPLGDYAVTASFRDASGTYAVSGTLTLTSLPGPPGHAVGSFDLSGSGLQITGSFATLVATSL